ncbi:MAG: glycosyltransferase family 4 protein [Pseudomonadota bacterium]|nr:glycosyltransferase family 4 protein [Pseudomonadota bacterium]
MRLLFVIKSVALPGGGTERVLADLAARLARRGHALTVASFDSPDDPPFYTLDPAVQRRALPIGNVRQGTRPGEALRRALALRRLLREVRPDVAAGFMHSAYIPLGLAALGTGVPIIASEHIAYQHYRTRRLEAVLLRISPRISRVITAVSPAIRDGFPRRIRDRMVVVPNPVAVDGSRTADVLGEGRGVKTLLAVGRLEAQKDHKTLIAAFARIAAEFPDWRLRVVGEGSLRSELEAQVERLGVSGRVELPGPTAEVAEEYVAAQLFAMPSSYESFGLTTAEALSYGLPVVGFADCPGTNELVQDGVNGLLAGGDPREEALAQALARLMASPELRARMGAAGLASSETFAPEKVAAIWEGLIRRVACSGRAPEAVRPQHSK